MASHARKAAPSAAPPAPPLPKMTIIGHGSAGSRSYELAWSDPDELSDEELAMPPSRRPAAPVHHLDMRDVLDVAMAVWHLFGNAHRIIQMPGCPLCSFHPPHQPEMQECSVDSSTT